MIREVLASGTRAPRAPVGREARSQLLLPSPRRYVINPELTCLLNQRLSAFLEEPHSFELDFVAIPLEFLRH
jgi:hypothetical protein